MNNITQLTDTLYAVEVQKDACEYKVSNNYNHWFSYLHSKNTEGLFEMEMKDLPKGNYTILGEYVDCSILCKDKNNYIEILLEMGYREPYEYEYDMFVSKLVSKRLSARINKINCLFIEKGCIFTSTPQNKYVILKLNNI